MRRDGPRRAKLTASLPSWRRQGVVIAAGSGIASQGRRRSSADWAERRTYFVDSATERSTLDALGAAGRR